MICPNCKKELPEGSIVCNYCGTSLNSNMFNQQDQLSNIYQHQGTYIQNNGQAEVKKNSVLGIIAFICSLACLGPIGLLLGVIDLFVNKKNKHDLAIAAIVIGGICSLIILWSLITGKYKEYTGSSNSYKDTEFTDDWDDPDWTDSDEDDVEEDTKKDTKKDTKEKEDNTIDEDDTDEQAYNNDESAESSEKSESELSEAYKKILDKYTKKINTRKGEMLKEFNGKSVEKAADLYAKDVDELAELYNEGLQEMADYAGKTYQYNDYMGAGMDLYNVYNDAAMELYNKYMDVSMDSLGL